MDIMMVVNAMNFDIKKSNKSNINAPEQFMVIYCGYIIFRIIGVEGKYVISTATTAEDSGFPLAYDQKTLMEAAMLSFEEEGWTPQNEYDMNNNEYVTINGSFEYLSDPWTIIDLTVKNIEKINNDRLLINP
jgi:hypothetical protein